ncbi:MAG: chondroitinase-B domain-containing protein [Candidatus Binatia bacterium]
MTPHKNLTIIGKTFCRLLCFYAVFGSSSALQALDFNPLCYSESGGNVRKVSTCALLDAALSNANPGDIIILADGDYNCDRIASKSGTSMRPIIIRAANPRQAKFTNASFAISGNYNVLANLTFDNSGINITGDFNRISNNKFQNNGGVLKAAVTVQRGNHNRIDHNEVLDYGAGQRGLRIIPSSNRRNNTAKNNILDRNYLHRSLGPRQNGADGIQLGSSDDHTYERLNTIVEYNLIERWEIDNEMISNKSSDNIIRFNTLADSKADGQVRHGSFVRIVSNYFFNVRGLINYGDDNQIIGNVVENGDLIIRNGDVNQSDIPLSSGPTGHPASLRTLVATNTVINGEICVGCRVPGGDNSSGIPARFTDLRRNSAKIRLLDQENTTQGSTYAGISIPAIRLRQVDVGPGSPDVCDKSASSGNVLPAPPAGFKVIQTF